ncbi:hypothetical protein BASA62_001488, partial [Batrachochytrium salamandrivorans]
MSTVNAEKIREKEELDHEKQLLQSTNDIEAVDESYAEQFVSTIAPTTDDPNDPSLTIRMVVLGTVFAIFLGLVNGIFSFRTVSFAIPSSLVALLSYPIGILCAAVLPRGILNPGPFTIKEHTLIYMIASAAGGKPYGIENVVGQLFPKFLDDSNVTFWNSFLFILCTQMIGYGLSGMTRRFLVRPGAMYWPGNLPTLALFVSFHNTTETEEVRKVGGLSRYGFFWVAFGVMFLWQWFPSYFAGALGSVSLLCMMSSDKHLRMLGSSSPRMGGMGILSLSFDWTSISFYGPLSTPWWASVNYFCGNVLMIWIVTPIMFYYNAFGNPPLQGPYTYDDDTPFPILNSPGIFTRTGKPQKAARLYNTVTYDLNLTSYDKVAPIYLTERFALQYAVSFFSLTCGLSHVALWYYKDIVRQTKEMLSQIDEASPDIHNTLMKAYPDIPEWMYLTWFFTWVVVMFFVTWLTPYKLPWWGVIFGLVIGFVFLVPFGIIQGSTGQQLGLNIITELLMGLFVPGQTVAVMTFKSYGYNIMIQALSLSGDLKIGHYLHINPIHMVFSQLWGTLIGAVCNTASVWIAIKSFPLDTADWLYTDHQTFFNAGAIWGAIGPARFFGPTSPYFGLNLGYVVGIFAPMLPWLANKAMPHPYWRFVHFPLLAFNLFSGYPGSIILSGFIVAFLFQYLAFTYAHGWWAKYNYVLSSALDSGAGL